MSRPAALALCAAAALSGCVKHYQPPKPGEPAAVVKVKIAYDHATALQAVPGNAHDSQLLLEVQGTEGKELFAVESKAWPDALAAATPAPLDVVPVTVHAGREVTLHVKFGVHWKTTQLKTVIEHERVPKTVTKQESYYDSSSRSTKYRTVTRTEYESRQKTVQKNVTESHARTCTASLPLRPEKDAVYLVDYANLALAADCTAVGFRQVGKADGSFDLVKL